MLGVRHLFSKHECLLRAGHCARCWVNMADGYPVPRGCNLSCKCCFMGVVVVVVMVVMG